MILRIPEIGNRFRLTKDWEFRLYPESRTTPLVALLFGVSPKSDLITELEYSYHIGRSPNPYVKFMVGDYFPATLLKGAILKIDRMYIRQGAHEYNSITFYLQEGKGFIHGTDRTYEVPKNKSVRFWAKLAEVNNAEMEWILEG